VLSLHESIVFAFEFTFELVIPIVMPHSVHIHSNYCFWFLILLTFYILYQKWSCKKRRK